MSLRLRLTLNLSLAFVLLWGLTATWMLYDLHNQMMQALDQRLAASARMVAGMMAQLPSASVADDFQQPLSAEQLGIPNGLTCQISSLRGQVLARSHATADRTLDANQPGFRTQLIEGLPWRSFTLEHDGLRITTADRLDERTTLENAIWLSAATPVALALLGSLLVLWLGIGHGLAPLRQISEALTRRNAGALSPLPAQTLPSELRPLVETQNQLFERIAQAVERERQLTNDVAHELRSPLTVIKTHLQVAHITEGETARQALVQAEKGADRLQHTLEQLLLLARVEGSLSFEDGQQYNAEQIARQAIEDTGQAIELLLTPEIAQATLNIPPLLAITALRNLLDNALCHSGTDAPVRLSVLRQAGHVSFQVKDQGPGLSAEQLPQATRRFWRQSAHGGSGLGLAIVQAIVECCGCELKFNNQPDGLLVTLNIPGQPQHPALTAT